MRSVHAVCSGAASLRFLVAIIGVRSISDEPPNIMPGSREIRSSRNSRILTRKRDARGNERKHFI